MKKFSRIDRLPPYTLGIVNELKHKARQRGEDIIDFGLGNPDQPTPKHIIEKLCEAAVKNGMKTCAYHLVQWCSKNNLKTIGYPYLIGNHHGEIPV